MLQVIINLLTLKALSTSAEVYAGLAAVWLLMLAAGIASVLSRTWSPALKFFWCLVLVALPVAGMAVYCLCCLFVADYSFLKVLGLSRTHREQLAPKPSAARKAPSPP